MDDETDVGERIQPVISTTTRLSMAPEFDSYRNTRGSSIYCETSLTDGNRPAADPVYSGLDTHEMKLHFT
jgi:hypothetical protein